MSVERHIESLFPTWSDMASQGFVTAPLAAVLIQSLVATLALQALLGRALPDQPVLAGIARTLLWAGAIAAPLVSAVRSLTMAALAWAVAALIAEPARLRPLVSVFLYGEAILAVSGPINVLALLIRGLDRIAAPSDLLVPLGPDLLIEAGSATVASLLRTASVVHIAWFIFLCAAIHRSIGTSRSGAAIIALTAWTGILVVAVVQASFST